jgi:7-carboxy-7-deazaguanine synthase
LSYAVKEVFYTLQGEGANAGRPAVFLRFAGCNLWSGRAPDRGKGMGGCSVWCDTDFVGTDGPGGGRFPDAIALADAVARTWGIGTTDRRFVVCTGGEPLLQLDASLIALLHQLGFEIAVETNGTIQPPPGIDWVCVSPKSGSRLVLKRGNELKLVFPQEGINPAEFEHLEFEHFYLQPKDDPLRAHNTQAAIDYCLSHPKWRLGLQTHKMVGLA